MFFRFKLSKNNLGLLALAALFFITSFLFHKPVLVARTNYISPPIEIKYLNFGFSNQLADSFWLRAVQDFDFCSENINEKECSGKSWLFNILNMCVEYDKNFLEAYFYGGLSLTVLISDYAGASVLFDKGVAVFNTDWHLLYTAAYHALIEEKNKLKASKLYLQAVDNGAPAWVRSMAGRLAAESGDSSLAKDILNQLISLESDPVWIEKLKKKIAQTK